MATSRRYCAGLKPERNFVLSAHLDADAAPVPYKVILQMIKHPLTDAGIERF